MAACAAAQSAAFRGRTVAAVPGHSSLAEGSQRWAGSRSESRSGRCMRQGEGEIRSWLGDLPHSALQDGGPGVNWEERGEACCSQGALTRFEGAVSLETSFVPPKGASMVRSCMFYKSIYIPALALRAQAACPG